MQRRARQVHLARSDCTQLTPETMHKYSIPTACVSMAIRTSEASPLWQAGAACARVLGAERLDWIDYPGILQARDCTDA